MAVKRIFVEKRQGFFDVPAQRLCSDLVETFRLTDLRAVRIITRYDIEGLSDEEFAKVRNIVFADPPVDTVYEDALPVFSDARIFAVEPLPGQFDPTAAAAAECVQLVTQGERPDVRTARVIVLIGKLDDRVYEKIKAYLINKVESREASLATPATLETRIVLPMDVEVLTQFNQLSRSELERFHKEHGFAMSEEDLAFVQQYFRDTEHRAPTITELRVIDTICEATSLRQEAAAKLANDSDIVVVIGGRNSANTTRLAQICSTFCPRTHHIESSSELEGSWFEDAENIGVTAGASTPQSQIDDVIAAIGRLVGTEGVGV